MTELLAEIVVRRSIIGAMIAVGSFAVLFRGFPSFPPETVAVFITLVGEGAVTLTAKAMAG